MWGKVFLVLACIAFCAVAVAVAQPPWEDDAMNSIIAEPRRHNKSRVLDRLAWAAPDLVPPHTVLCRDPACAQQEALAFYDQRVNAAPDGRHRRFILKPAEGTCCGTGVFLISRREDLIAILSRARGSILPVHFMLQEYVPAVFEARITAWRPSTSAAWRMDPLVIHKLEFPAENVARAATDCPEAALSPIIRNGHVETAATNDAAAASTAAHMLLSPGEYSLEHYQRPLGAEEQRAWDAVLSRAFPRSRMLAVDLRLQQTEETWASWIVRQRALQGMEPVCPHDLPLCLPTHGTPWRVLEVNGAMGFHHTWFAAEDRALGLGKDFLRFLARRVAYGAGHVLARPLHSVRAAIAGFKEWRQQAALEKAVAVWASRCGLKVARHQEEADLDRREA
jgi:hypothetical protein